MTHLSDPSLYPVAPGHIALVGAGPGAADLLTLRALRRITEADIVFYDRLIDPAVLDLIPAQTQRVNVGKEVGQNAWPQGRIDTEIVAAALRGLNVVRLKSGDPSIFGRASEEIAAAQAAGITVEVVPGITAASAAAASACDPLTVRGRFTRLVMATATSVTGATPLELADGLPPGTRLALYMGVRAAGDIQRQLLAAGVAPDAPVRIVENVSTRGERTNLCALGTLAATVVARGVKNPAIMLIDIAQRVEPATMTHGRAGVHQTA